MMVGTIFAYSLFSSIVLSVLYLTYKWVLSGEKQFGLNRALLWSIYIVSLLLFPLLKLISGIGHESPVELVPGVEVGEIHIEVLEDDMVPSAQSFFKVLLWIYLSGVAAAIIYTLLTLVHLIRLISRCRTVEIREKFRILVSPDSAIAPFSWYRYVVMSESDYRESGNMIAIHEMRHLMLNHWVDLLIAQLVSIFQWYNPAAWLMREELKSVHEYQADMAVMKSGVSVRDYQMLLIKKAVGARFPSLANSLNHSKLKKRITMMYKSKSSASRYRGLALVPALAAALAVTNNHAVASMLSDVMETRLTVSDDKVTQNASERQYSETVLLADEAIGEEIQTETPERPSALMSSKPSATEVEGSVSATPEESDEVHRVAQEAPQFPGGESALINYLSQHVVYPESAAKEKVQGRVVVRFVVKKDGKVDNVEVIRSVDPRLDAEAVRVASQLPAFTPGKVDGKPVNVMYALPISFTLSSDAEPTSQKSVADDNASIMINGNISIKNSDNHTAMTRLAGSSNVKYYVDGEPFEGDINKISPSDIKQMVVKKGKTKGEEARIYIDLRHGE